MQDRLYRRFVRELGYAYSVQIEMRSPYFSEVAVQFTCSLDHVNSLISELIGVLNQLVSEGFSAEEIRAAALRARQYRDRTHQDAGSLSRVHLMNDAQLLEDFAKFEAEPEKTKMLVGSLFGYCDYGNIKVLPPSSLSSHCEAANRQPFVSSLPRTTLPPAQLLPQAGQGTFSFLLPEWARPRPFYQRHPILTSALAAAGLAGLGWLYWRSTKEH